MNYFIKSILYITSIIFLSNCSTTTLVKQWKNPEAENISISKILIVGLTPNIKTREKFENNLKKEFKLKGIEAVISLNVFEPSFRTEKKSKKELKIIEDILIANYFDAIIFSKVKGVENKVIFSDNYYNKEYLTIKFKEDYYNHQDILVNPKYFEKYKIYHAETSLFCICPTKERELIWKGYIDIIDPKSIDETINDYINLLVLTLEEQQLIPY
ncbi:conserved protein of unknown function [Tenacibaculum sp. 190524A02b]|uniref:hypothetical protein n=1 Tax=Tenacibaculum vairaonense TaxID=3137860 RepID=UPI0032B30E2E